MYKKYSRLAFQTWTSYILFGLSGQILWIVCNSHLIKYISRIYPLAQHLENTHLLLSICAVLLASIVTGAVSDYIGKRRPFVVYGYIAWGLSAFLIMSLSYISKPPYILILSFIFMFSFFGGMASHAAFNGWVSDSTTILNRSFVDSIGMLFALSAVLSMHYINLLHKAFPLCFLISGCIAVIIGIVGIFTFKEGTFIKHKAHKNVLLHLSNGFTISDIKNNYMIYVCLIAIMFSTLASGFWMPQIVVLIQLNSTANIMYALSILVISIGAMIAVSLKMDNNSKKKYFFPIILMGGAAALVLSLIYTNPTASNLLQEESFYFKTIKYIALIILLFTHLMTGALFASTTRDYIPRPRIGGYQSARIIISIYFPILINNFLLSNTDYSIYNAVIWKNSFFAAFIFILLMMIPACIVRKDADKLRSKRLEQLRDL